MSRKVSQKMATRLQGLGAVRTDVVNRHIKRGQIGIAGQCPRTIRTDVVIRHIQRNQTGIAGQCLGSDT